MGKVQCKTENNKDLIEIIEQKMKAKNTNLDKKIEKEYLKIINLTHSTIINSTSPLKCLSGNYKKTKEETYLKWYKMASTGKIKPMRVLVKSLSKFQSSNFNLPSTEMIKMRFSNGNPIKIADVSNQIMHQFNRTQSTTFLSDMHKKFDRKNNKIKLELKEEASSKYIKTLEKNRSQIDLPQIQTNYTEKGLRSYIIEKKDKFFSRVTKGPPELFRWISWIITIGVPEDRDDKLYDSLINFPIDKEIDNQINKDLHRTLSEDNIFLLEDTRKTLYRLLKSFAIYDREVSYCQGMNFIAGFLLIMSDFNEIDSFYMLLSIFTKKYSNKFGIRGFYINEFPMLRFYVYQFDHIFMKFLPDLKKHFDMLEVPNELWVGKWFQALYTNCLTYEMVTRLWDCLIINGLIFLHNFTLSILQYLEQDLLKCNDICDVADIFNFMNPYSEGKSQRKNVNINEIIENALKFDIPIKLLIKLKNRYEKQKKFDLSVYQNLSNEFNESVSFIQDNQDLSFSEISCEPSKDSFGDNLPNSTKNSLLKKFTYDKKVVSTCINSNTNKNDDEYISESEEKIVRETSVCSEVDLFEKSKIENRMKNYILNTKVINKYNKKINKIKLIKK